MKVKEKLRKIQQELIVPKDQYNKFGNFYYRSCESILEHVKPLLGEAVLTFEIDIVNVGDRVYVKATAILTEEGESVSSTAFAREDFEKKKMDGSQLTGSAMSYAKKYALGGLFCLDDSKDSDKLNDGKKENKISKELLDKINNAKTVDELNKLWVENKNVSGIVEFLAKRKGELC